MVFLMVELLPKNIKDKIEALIAQSGIAYDENVVMTNIQLTGMPQDDFITSSFVRRAKEVASDIPEKYRCEGCGRAYENRNELVACMQDHSKDFMAGIPIDVLPEYQEEKMSKFPPQIRREMEELSRTGRMPIEKFKEEKKED